MVRVEKTVFICYRRTNIPWALAIFQALTQHGYDVFFDFESIDSGDFERVIVENIKARAHFLVLLTPSALEGCSRSDDWLRREIETALDTQRNIVPLMLEGFDFGSPSIASQLTGKLAALKQYNALHIPAGYFQEAMNRLRERFLNVPLSGVLHPASSFARQLATEQQMAANNAPVVQQNELTAQEWFERALNISDLGEQLRCYDQVIRLLPDNAPAYYHRGIVRTNKGDLEGAIQDFTEVIGLRPNHAHSYYNRGIVHANKGDLKDAYQDFTKAIVLDRSYAQPYYSRATIRNGTGDLEGALQDYTQAISLDPGYVDAYNNRGNVRRDKGDLEGALQDYIQAIRLDPGFAPAYSNRGNVCSDKGDLEGALQDYTQAIYLDPSFADAYLNRAETWETKGDFIAAIADYQKYLDLGGGNEDREDVKNKIVDLRKKTLKN